MLTTIPTTKRLLILGMCAGLFIPAVVWIGRINDWQGVGNPDSVMSNEETVYTPPPALESFPRVDFEGVVPEGFPADVPIEAGAVITQSYRVHETGYTQMSLVYDSSDSYENIQALYEEYFQDSDWFVTLDHMEEMPASVYAIRRMSEIGTVISKTPNGTAVVINLLEKKP